MRLLGIDFGGKRIGVAVAESDHKISSPRPALEASGTLKRDADNIHALLKKEQAEQIVLGVPLDENGGDTKMSRVIKTLGGNLESLGLLVHYVDESMTSVGAEGSLREHDWTAAQRRRHIDSEAACRILERFMNA
jgi:putative holliday junction resolvase